MHAAGNKARKAGLHYALYRASVFSISFSFSESYHSWIWRQELVSGQSYFKKEYPKVDQDSEQYYCKGGAIRYYNTVPPARCNT